MHRLPAADLRNALENLPDTLCPPFMFSFSELKEFEGNSTPPTLTFPTSCPLTPFRPPSSSHHQRSSFLHTTAITIILPNSSKGPLLKLNPPTPSFPLRVCQHAFHQGIPPFY